MYSRKNGFIRAKVVDFGKKWLYLGKSCRSREKLAVFG